MWPHRLCGKDPQRFEPRPEALRPPPEPPRERFPKTPPRLFEDVGAKSVPRLRRPKPLGQFSPGDAGPKMSDLAASGKRESPGAQIVWGKWHWRTGAAAQPGMGAATKRSCRGRNARRLPRRSAPGTARRRATRTLRRVLSRRGPRHAARAHNERIPVKSKELSQLAL